MNAADIMTQPVITVTPDTPVDQVAQLLLDRQISAVPVVEDGRAIGIVSEGDLIRRIESGTTERTSWWLRWFAPIERLADDYVKVHGLTARDVMSSPVIGVSPETPAPEIAELLESRRIKRVPVMDGDRIVGIVSRANLLQAVAAGRHKATAEMTPTDAELRRLILERVHAHPWAGSMILNVTVSDRTAELWGLVANDRQADAVRVVAERTRGVTAVIDHLQRFDPRSISPD